MWAQRLAIAGGIALVVFALYAAQVVLVPIALALLLSFLLTPVCNRLEHLRIPRGVAVVMTMLLVVGVLGGLLYMTYGGLDRILEQRSAYRDAIVQKVQTLGGGGMLKKLEEAEQAVEDVSAAVQGAPTEPSTQPADPATTQPEVDHGETGLLQIGGLTDAVDDVGQRVEDVEQTVDALGTANNPVVTEPLPASAGMVEQLSSVLGIVTEPVGTLGLTSVFALFILLERDRLRDKVLRLASGGKLNIATQALEEAGSRISRYLLAQAIVNGSYGIVVGIGLNVISFVLTGAAFPSWPLWVVLCITLRFIPYVGPIVGGLLPMMVALGEYEGFGVFLWVALMFIVVEIWSNQLMEPWLYGSSTGISPVGVIAAATFWVWLWGIEGLILSTPLTVCLFVLGKYAPPLKFFDILLRDEEVFDDATRLYQRLLALDEDATYEIAERYVEQHTLAEFFDLVLLRALAMAERDRHAGVLSQERQAFINETLRDVIFNVGEAGADCDEPVDSAGRHAVVLPARDEADELAGAMLGRVMRACGFGVTVLADEALVTEMEDVVRRERPAAVVLSAVPPAALAHARYVVKKVADDLGDARLVVALWTSDADPRTARNRLPERAHVSVTRTIAETVDAVRQAVAARVK